MTKASNEIKNAINEMLAFEALISKWKIFIFEQNFLESAIHCKFFHGKFYRF